MRIHTVCQETNLTKKAIYFYIHEGLLNPKHDENNNYLDFSEDDLKRLKIINILRQLDLPISKIKELIKHPTMSNYFLHEQLNIAREELLKNISLIRGLNCVLNHIPPQYSFNDLLNIKCNLLDTTNEDLDRLNIISPNKDARIVAIIVWSSFLNVETTEYRLFLWNKISYQANIQLSDSLHYVTKVLYNLSPDIIEEDARKRYLLSHKLIGIKDDNFDNWIEYMIKQLRRLLDSKELQAYWSINYNKVLIPLLEYINGDMQKLVTEYNHDYQLFLDNINSLDSHLNDMLLNGELNDLYLELKACLDGKFDIINYPNLVSFNCFEASLFYKLPYKQLLSILEEDK